MNDLWRACYWRSLCGACPAPRFRRRIRIARAPRGCVRAGRRDRHHGAPDHRRADGSARQPSWLEKRPGAKGYLAGTTCERRTRRLHVTAAENALADEPGALPQGGERLRIRSSNTTRSPPLRASDGARGRDGVKANTVQELSRSSKAGPQKMNYASAGIGSVTIL